ncbi:hypothetical protein [Streptomyces sp. NPDC002746]
MTISSLSRLPVHLVAASADRRLVLHAMQWPFSPSRASPPTPTVASLKPRSWPFPDDPDGYMSRLADSIEAIQLGTARELLIEASETLDDQDASLHQMRCPVIELTGALRDVYRVATTRGHLRLTSYPGGSAY